MGSPDLPISPEQKKAPAFQPPDNTADFVTRFGLAMKRHPRRIALIQWSMVGIYAFLLFAPLFSPATEKTSLFWKDLPLFSVFIFWGIGWPLIMLSTMIFGRIWCGVFCPEGTLTEAISGYGQKRPIPRWLRWPGWPCLMLVSYSLFLFLSDAVRHHMSSFNVLGSLTLFAILTGFLFGNARRVWCMYLCPSNAVFTFLAKTSLLYFRVDPKKWDRYEGTHERINCAPLINIKQMQSTSSCHACGRCSGYRDAVALSLRKPAQEILSASSSAVSAMQALTLLFGMSGMGAATLLASRNLFGALPETGLPLVLFLIFICALMLGSVLWGSMWLAGKTAGLSSVSWPQLSLGLIPLTGIGLVLGFSSLSLDFMPLAAWGKGCLITLQLLLLFSAFLFSLWLGSRLILVERKFRRVTALTIYAAACILLFVVWFLVLST